MSNPTKEQQFKELLRLLIEEHEKTIPDISRAIGVSANILYAARHDTRARPRPFKATDRRIELLRAYLKKVESEPVELPEEKLKRIETEYLKLKIQQEQQQPLLPPELEATESELEELRARVRALESEIKELKEKEKNGVS